MGKNGGGGGAGVEELVRAEDVKKSHGLCGGRLAVVRGKRGGFLKPNWWWEGKSVERRGTRKVMKVKSLVRNGWVDCDSAKHKTRLCSHKTRRLTYRVW